MIGAGREFVQGFAWVASLDLDGEAEASGSSPLAPGPGPGPRLSWWVEGTEPKLGNPIWSDTWLLLTDTPEPPGTAEGWSVEPANLAEGFVTDDGSAWLGKVLAEHRTSFGIVLKCEFVVAGAGTGAGSKAPGEAVQQERGPKERPGPPPGRAGDRARRVQEG